MNFLKSIFYTLFILFVGFNAVYSSVNFFQKDESVYWFSAAICAVAAASYFIHLHIKRPFGVKVWLVVLYPLIGATFLITMGRFNLEIESEEYPVYASAFVLIGWTLYHFWYSKLAKKSIAAIGSWTFTDSSGKDFDLLSQQAKLRVIVFHRGSSCPFSMAHVRSLSEQMEEFTSRNTQLSFVANMGPLEASKLAKLATPGANSLTDPDLKSSSSIGINENNAIPAGFGIFGYKSQQPLPSFIILDTSGKILHSETYKDYRDRKSVGYILRWLDEKAKS